MVAQGVRLKNLNTRVKDRIQRGIFYILYIIIYIHTQHICLNYKVTIKWFLLNVPCFGSILNQRHQRTARNLYNSTRSAGEPEDLFVLNSEPGDPLIFGRTPWSRSKQKHEPNIRFSNHTPFRWTYKQCFGLKLKPVFIEWHFTIGGRNH